VLIQLSRRDFDPSDNSGGNTPALREFLQQTIKKRAGGYRKAGRRLKPPPLRGKEEAILPGQVLDRSVSPAIFELNRIRSLACLSVNQVCFFAFGYTLSHSSPKKSTASSEA
jgi:hypothetical protein